LVLKLGVYGSLFSFCLGTLFGMILALISSHGR
jgi:hypothetical protein